METLVFWPGQENSSLSYILINDSTQVVEKIISKSVRSTFMHLDGESVIAGEPYSKIRHSESDAIENIFDAPKNKNSAFDALDKTALLLTVLVNKITEDLKRQFGMKLKNTTEILVLDFAKTYNEHALRAATIFNAYAGRPARIVDGYLLLEKLSHHRSNKNSEIIILADDCQLRDANLNNDVLCLDIYASIKSLENNLQQEGLDDYTAICMIEKLLMQIKDTAFTDWVEVSNTEINSSENVLNTSVIDRLSFDLQLANQLSEYANNITKNLDTHSFIVVGAFADSVRDQLNEQYQIEISSYDRDWFIKRIMANSFYEGGIHNENYSLGILIDAEEAGTLKTSQAQSEVEITHTVRLFGREEDTLVIHLTDSSGPILSWDVVLHTIIAVDIFDLIIKIKANHNNCFTCDIESTDNIYISSTQHPVYIDGKQRSIHKNKQIISLN